MSLLFTLWWNLSHNVILTLTPSFPLPIRNGNHRLQYPLVSIIWFNIYRIIIIDYFPIVFVFVWSDFTTSWYLGMLMRIQCCYPRIKTHASATGMVERPCMWRQLLALCVPCGCWRSFDALWVEIPIAITRHLCVECMHIMPNYIIYVCIYVCIYIYIYVYIYIHMCTDYILGPQRERERERQRKWDYLPHLSDLLACIMIDYKCIQICNTNDDGIQIYMDMSMTDMAQNILRNGMVWC